MKTDENNNKINIYSRYAFAKLGVVVISEEVMTAKKKMMMKTRTKMKTTTYAYLVSKYFFLRGKSLLTDGSKKADLFKCVWARQPHRDGCKGISWRLTCGTNTRASPKM